MSFEFCLIKGKDCTDKDKDSWEKRQDYRVATGCGEWGWREKP